jgi:predicted nuclease of predicted toxin-antitoxin system
MRTTLAVECVPVRDLNLHRASDLEIFEAARDRQVVVVTKDADFVALLEQHGPPPQVVWLTCGNTSNASLRRLLEAAWPTVLSMLSRGEGWSNSGINQVARSGRLGNRRLLPRQRAHVIRRSAGCGRQLYTFAVAHGSTVREKASGPANTPWT